MRCEVMVYPLEVGATAGKWKEKGKRRRKWFAPEKAAEAVAEPELSELIRAFAGAQRRAGLTDEVLFAADRGTSGLARANLDPVKLLIRILPY